MKNMTSNNPSLKCMLVNARSINNKVYKLTELLIRRSISICCVTETWTKEGTEPVIGDIKREGYNIISLPRSNKRGGGIAFISEANKFKTQEVKLTNYVTFEVQEVLLFGKGESVRFSTVYRTGYLSVENRGIFINEINDYMDSLLPKEGINVVWGDFNIRPDGKELLNLEFMDIMELKGFKQLVHNPTHIGGGILRLSICAH